MTANTRSYFKLEVPHCACRHKDRIIADLPEHARRSFTSKIKGDLVKTKGSDPFKSPLVSLLAADPRIVTSKGGTAWLGTIVLDSAAYDLVEIMQRKHPRIYDRAFGKDSAFWTDASPYRRLTAAPAPMFLVCSTKRSDACPPTQTFASKATELGGKVTVLPVDMKHGELNKELGLPSDYTTTIESFMHSLGLP